MPFTDKQIRLFAAAAHDKGIAKSSGIPMHKARKMLMESSGKQRSRAAKRTPVRSHAMK
jgi:hypothetical protein